MTKNSILQGTRNVNNEDFMEKINKLKEKVEINFI